MRVSWVQCFSSSLATQRNWTVSWTRKPFLSTKLAMTKPKCGHPSEFVASDDGLLFVRPIWALSMPLGHFVCGMRASLNRSVKLRLSQATISVHSNIKHCLYGLNNLIKIIAAKINIVTTSASWNDTFLWCLSVCIIVCVCACVHACVCLSVSLFVWHASYSVMEFKGRHGNFHRAVLQTS